MRRIFATIAAALLLASCIDSGDTLENFRLAGKVTAVEDGDTLTIAGRGASFRIRLSDIDTPEIRHGDRPGQPFGRAAGESLRDLAQDREAVARCYEIDRYGRAVCHVIVAGVNTSQEQLRRGWAWVPENPAWIRDTASKALESEARAAGRGIWQESSPTAPWTWRQACWRQQACPGAE